MDMKPLEQTARAFATLDFSAEEARLAELEAERDNIDAAIERANARRTEISQAQRDWRDAERVSASNVADALLGGAHAAEVTALAPDAEALKEEFANLSAAIGELRRRYDDVQAEMNTLRTHTRGKAAAVAQPLADALRAQAKRAAEELLECYAGLQALHTAIGAGAREVGQARHAAAGCIGNDRLLSWRSGIPVPPMVAQVLDALPQSKALVAGCGQTVLTPENSDHLSVIAALSDRTLP
ncbi:hypothetical protein GCM10011494_02780 [Novosphingobium endophyticum]|uniref:Uncharacterized protein n=1 Tax=Novosphingobium endophyticum TaxID=1955250 RepID=A0A916TRQ6_9SPHN|nr:hypothetical protein [Novosphingobium endophyticum]GGB87881.1 hypothetical protein GCM10011494_02780 [Novosphingobium endophyticum]